MSLWRLVNTAGCARRILKSMYNALLLSGKLTEHLIGVEAECRERLETLLPQMMRQEGVDEALKARDQMEWVVQDEQHPEPSRRNPAERTGLRLNHKVGVMQPLSPCPVRPNSHEYGAELHLRCALPG